MPKSYGRFNSLKISRWLVSLFRAEWRQPRNATVYVTTQSCSWQATRTYWHIERSFTTRHEKINSNNNFIILTFISSPFICGEKQTTRESTFPYKWTGVWKACRSRSLARKSIGIRSTSMWVGILHDKARSCDVQWYWRWGRSVVRDLRLEALTLR